jgi:PAS domain S-box-containing protein
MRVALRAVPIVLFNQDTDLRYTWMWNPAAHFSVEEVLGKTDVDLFPPEEAADLMEVKRQVIESGRGTHRQFRTTIEGKSRVYDLTVEPLRNSEGIIVGITCARVEPGAGSKSQVNEVDSQ